MRARAPASRSPASHSVIGVRPPARYREHFLKTIRNVCEPPAQHLIEHQPDIRRVRLRLFPLTIIYRERDSIIQVLAVAHYRRSPRYWLSRVTRSSS